MSKKTAAYSMANAYISTSTKNEARDDVMNQHPEISSVVAGAMWEAINAWIDIDEVANSYNKALSDIRRELAVSCGHNRHAAAFEIARKALEE